MTVRTPRDRLQRRALVFIGVPTSTGYVSSVLPNPNDDRHEIHRSISLTPGDLDLPGMPPEHSARLLEIEARSVLRRLQNVEAVAYAGIHPSALDLDLVVDRIRDLERAFQAIPSLRLREDTIITLLAVQRDLIDAARLVTRLLRFIAAT